jgi:IS30 family transposase
MDRAQLKAWLDAGLSLPQIGALTTRDPSTVGYWVQKHGLTANGQATYAPRGGLTREQLEPLVERGATLQQMADELERSTSTVRHWLKKYGLETKNRRGPRPQLLRREVEAALSNGSRALIASVRTAMRRWRHALRL